MSHDNRGWRPTAHCMLYTRRHVGTLKMEATSSSKTPAPICRQDGNHVVACLQQTVHQWHCGCPRHDRPLSTHSCTSREDGSRYCDRRPLTVLASVTDRQTDRRAECDTKQNTNRAHCKRVTHKRLYVCLSVCHAERQSYRNDE